MAQELEAELGALLGRMTLFAHLSAADHAALLEHAHEAVHGAGDVIIAEGTHTDHVYVIAAGEVKVSTASFGREVELVVLGAGQYFGEVSLMSGKTATATVTVITTPTRLIAIDRAFLLDLIARDEQVRHHLEGVTLERAKDTIAKVLL